jgi:uncharacterized protein with HEPN domain
MQLSSMILVFKSKLQNRNSLKSKMQKDELEKIKFIYEALYKISEFTAGMASEDELTSNNLILDAVKMNLIVIYENYLKLDVETKDKYKQIEWNKILEYKSLVINMTMGFDTHLIWKLINEEILEFKKRIEGIL